ncbi:MAG: hypothetical protein KY437_00830 [Actinobacteria bacterium]|nr:hypothetical protein [Actinomycetota bacterium]
MARHGRLTVVTLVLAVLVLTLATATVVVRRQTAVTVDDAVEAFRADLGTPPPSLIAGAPSPSTGSTVPTPDTDVAADPPGSRPSTQPDPSEAPATPLRPTVHEEVAAPPTQPSGSRSPDPQPTLTVPEEGVYTYATDGSESIEALGGARHEYPDRTTITVRHDDCGYTARWEPLRERWEEFDICRDNHRARMRTITLYHEFFERGIRHEYVCGEDATIAEVPSEPGTQWSWECHSDGGSMRTVVEILGFDTRDVGGTPVEAVHVRIHNTMDGDTRGTRQAEVWYDRWSGLELHGTYHTDTMVDTPMGSTRYVERIERTLTDVRPRR